MTENKSSFFLRPLLLVLIVFVGLFCHFNNHNSSGLLALPLNAEEVKGPTSSLEVKSNQTPDLSDWKSFSSEKYGFQFKYPPDGKVQTYSTTGRKEVRIGLPVTGKTLLNQKFFRVKVERAFEGYPGSPSGKEPGTMVLVNDRKFLKREVEEGAAGHIYDHTIYSTIAGAHRFVFDFVLHSVNPGVFDSPPPGFDRSETDVFSRIVSTLKFKE